jgi:hypothetical protein
MPVCGAKARNGPVTWALIKTKTAAFRGLPTQEVTVAGASVAGECVAVAACAGAEADAGVEHNFLKYRRKIPS